MSMYLEGKVSLTVPLKQFRLCSLNHCHTDRCAITYLKKQPLFDILGGIPLCISVVAPMLLRFSVKELFEKVISSSLLTFMQGRIEVDSLIMSIEFSVRLLQESNPKAIEIFYLIGITQEGLYEDDLFNIFEEAQENKESIS